MNDFETTGQVHALARRVAALWEGWEYKEPQGENMPVTAWLAGPEEREITLRADHIFARSADGWRVIVSGHYPRDGGQGMLRLDDGEKPPQITVSIGRADGVIVTDIQQRFLLRYERCYEQALSERDGWRAHVGTVEARTLAIAAALGEQATAKTLDLRGEVYASHPGDHTSVKVAVYERESHWDIRYATPELEARLAEVLWEALR